MSTLFGVLFLFRSIFVYTVLKYSSFCLRIFLSTLSGVLFFLFRSVFVLTVGSTLLVLEFSCLYCLEYSSFCLELFFLSTLCGVLFFFFRSILVYSLEYFSFCLGVFLSTLSGVLFLLFRSILVFTVRSTLLIV